MTRNRKYTKREIQKLVNKVIYKVADRIKKRVKLDEYETINMDYEIDNALNSVTNFGRSNNWKFHTQEDYEILSDMLENSYDRIYEIANKKIK